MNRNDIDYFFLFFSSSPLAWEKVSSRGCPCFRLAESEEGTVVATARSCRRARADLSPPRRADSARRWTRRSSARPPAPRTLEGGAPPLAVSVFWCYNSAQEELVVLRVLVWVPQPRAYPQLVGHEPWPWNPARSTAGPPEQNKKNKKSRRKNRKKGDQAHVGGKAPGGGGGEVTRRRRGRRGAPPGGGR